MIKKLVRGCRLGDRASPLRGRTMVFSQPHTGQISCGDKGLYISFVWIIFIVRSVLSPNKNKIGTYLHFIPAMILKNYYTVEEKNVQINSLFQDYLNQRRWIRFSNLF